MKDPTVHKNTVRIIAMTAGLSLTMSAKALVPVSDLPDFDNLPSFAQLGNQLQHGSSTVNGNVGVSDGGTFSGNTGTAINGALYVGNGATATTAGTVTGGTFTGQDLSLEEATVFSASEGLSALSPDEVINTLETGPLSFDVPAGEVYVVNLNGGLSLSSPDGITVTGGGDLVLNIGTSFAMTFSSITGPDPSNIFINYTGTANVNLFGDIDGQLFLPNAQTQLSAGVLNGGVFSGNSFVVLNGQQVINQVPIPEPGVMALMSVGFIPFIVLAFRRLSSLKRLV